MDMTDDYHSLMEHYVGKYTKTSQDSTIYKAKMEYLAEQSLDNNLFTSELEWLVTIDAKNGYDFGYSLGMADKSLKLLPSILEAQKNAVRNPSLFLLAGYFMALFKRDPAKWESCLDSMLNDSLLYKYVPEVVCRSGMTDWAWSQIISLIKERNLDFSVLRCFIYIKGTLKKL